MLLKSPCRYTLFAGVEADLLWANDSVIEYVLHFALFFLFYHDAVTSIVPSLVYLISLSFFICDISNQVKGEKLLLLGFCKH